MSGFHYNKKDLKNGWDLPPNEKIPLTGRKQRLLRAYELLIVKSDEEYMKERCKDTPLVTEQPIQQSVSEDLFRPKSEPKPDAFRPPGQESEPEPVLEKPLQSEPEEPQIPERVSVTSFRPPGQ